ncbi:response regulator [candidate division KSB1 bacterium]|nr:response regulator [candidate division KSB1 bacterium]MBL7095357.1 response regulator [candidate division KSB1 bacterium]
MKRILIIDDDDQLRDMLRTMIEKEGYKVKDAPDGEVGMKLQDENPFDLIITDIIMPNKEGIAVITDMKSAYPDIKIIAISGGGRIVPNDYLGIAEKLGADRTLSKPFERIKLLQAIKELIR